MRKLSVYKVILCAFVGVGGALFAQETRTPADGSKQDSLLTEVRALRTEINQMAGTSIRTQLLVARLQLQEQRVLMSGRQLLEAQNAHAEVRVGIAGEQARVDRLEQSQSRGTVQYAQIQQAILAAKAEIQHQQSRQQELQARETELLYALNSEQARWKDLNDRLDALERSLPGW